MIEQIKSEIKNSLEKYYLDTYQVIVNLNMEVPKNKELGDLAIPLFPVLKALKKPLPIVTAEAKEYIEKTFLDIEVSIAGGYLNFKLDASKVAKTVLNDCYNNDNYGQNDIGANQTVVLDYSSPNIAKSFSVGHLRSTMIGNSLKLIHQKCGYKTVSINYLGDWGTQFGKMVVAYEMWADEEAIKKDPINEMTKLYVRINEAIKNDPSLEEKARQAFKKIEDGEEYYVNLWKYIREESLKESKQIYDLLDVSFDSYNGEAYYNDKMEPVVDELKAKNLLKEDQGAQIVDLGENIPPALIKRSDGGSLYITRDLAAVFDRYNTYHFSKALYVVGGEQKLHFTQLKAVLKKMGYENIANSISHIDFGLVLQNGKKMSTRSGNVVKLFDVLDQSINLAYKAINEKNPSLENKEEIARFVGVGAIVFNDLKNYRSLDYDFNLDNMLKFEGQTGPYLQYTSVRIASIIRDNKLDIENVDYSYFNEAHYYDLVKDIAMYKEIIIKASLENSPSVIAKYLLNMAQDFNRFYGMERINSEISSKKNANLLLSSCVRKVINDGLTLLGIKYLERM